MLLKADSNITNNLLRAILEERDFMKKIRILIIILTIVLIAALTACGEDQNDIEGKSDYTVNLKSAAVRGGLGVSF